MSMIFIGVDYSMNSPACTVKVKDQLSTLCLNSNKKYQGEFRPTNLIKYTVNHIEDWLTEEQRYDQLANQFIQFIISFDHDSYVLYIENYAMGAKGRMTSIGENTGIIKHKLYKLGLKINLTSPNELKKFAAIKGNANKELMADAYQQKFGFYVHDIIGCKKSDSPASDIVDSTFLSLYGENNGNS